MAKIGRFWPKTAKREFFSKIRLEHFFSLVKMQLCAKFKKNLMCGSPDIASRTNGRTNARTHERESIGPSANAERPKKNPQKCQFWRKTCQIVATNCHILAISEFLMAYRVWFPKNHENRFYTNKRAMLRSLGGSQIKNKNIKQRCQSQSFKNNNKQIIK